MKKNLRFLFTLLLSVVGVAVGSAQTEIDFTKQSITSTSNGFTLTVGDFTFTATKETGSNAPTQNSKTKDLRLYAKNKFVVSGASMSSITFTLSKQGKKKLTDITPSTGSVTLDTNAGTVTWTTTSAVSEVSFVVGDKATDGSSAAGQFDLDKASITTSGGDTPTPTGATAPTISGTTPFTESTTVTITAGTGATIFYTLDGQEPDDREGTEYTAPFTISATTTVKAIAYEGDQQSTVTTKEFVKIDPNAKGGINNPYTVAEATAILTAKTETTDAVYVKGIVSKVDEVSTRFGNATYYISDNGATEGQLEVFRAKTFGGEKYANVNALEVGDKVTLKGVLTNYTDKQGATTQEVTNASVVKQSTPITIGSEKYATAYYSGKNLTVPASVTASTYKVADETNVLTGTSHAAGEVIPAGEAVVLNGEAGTYDFEVVATTTATADADNQLLGTDAETQLSADANSLFYGLSLNAKKEANSVGFYWINADGSAFTNGAHKAYLKITKTATAAKGYLFNGTTDGINDINAEEEKADGAIYNIEGQRVGNDYKGIVIINGKKVIKK